MPKYKLKSEFLELGFGLVHSVFPQVAEATKLAKDLGFESSSPEDIELALKEKVAKVGAEAFSYLGAIVGAPLGLLPILMDYYSSGVGQIARQDASAAFRPFRLPPEVVFRLCWKLYKGEDLPDELLNDLRQQGWDEDRINKGLEASKVMPTPQDITNFLAHEVFEPDMIKKYGLESEWVKIDKEFAKKIGLDEDILKLYWRNHWIHPSLGSVYNMHHRDLIGKEDVDEYYRLVETPEYWRDKLTELSWDMPNRIEIRMMTRYLDLDKDFVIDMLKKAGLHEDYRDDAAKFMIVMGLYGYWSSTYRNGWMTKEELVADIHTKIDDPVIEERVYKRIVKAEKPQRLEEHRTLTRALIIKGWKVEEISTDEAVELLMAHQNYDRPEAEYILAVEEAAMGSPHTALEFKQLVNSYKKAIGEEVAEIPPEVLEAEKELRSLERQLKGAKELEAPPGELDQLQADIASAKAKYELLITYQGGSP